MRTHRQAGRSTLTRLPRLCAHASRLLILLSALLVVAMPFTEHFATFDHFLRGGPDLELGLLAFFASLSLVLLLAQYARIALSRVMALRHRLWSVRKVVQGAPSVDSSRFIQAIFAPPPISPLLRTDLPLLI